MRRDFVALVANEGVRRHCEGLSYSAGHPELLWAPPDSYSMGMHKFHVGVKRPEPEVDNSPPSCVEFKNAWSYTPLDHMFLFRHRDKFTFPGFGS
jgi:hypothetical protein